MVNQPPPNVVTTLARKLSKVDALKQDVGGLAVVFAEAGCPAPPPSSGAAASGAAEGWQPIAVPEEWRAWFASVVYFINVDFLPSLSAPFIPCYIALITVASLVFLRSSWTSPRLRPRGIETGIRVIIAAKQRALDDNVDDEEVQSKSHGRADCDRRRGAVERDCEAVSREERLRNDAQLRHEAEPVPRLRSCLSPIQNIYFRM